MNPLTLRFKTTMINSNCGYAQLKLVNDTQWITERESALRTQGVSFTGFFIAQSLCAVKRLNTRRLHTKTQAGSMGQGGNVRIEPASGMFRIPKVCLSMEVCARPCAKCPRETQGHSKVFQPSNG